MLHLSTIAITLGKSADYVKLACLIHVFAVIVLLNSSLPMLLSMGLLFVLILSAISIVRLGIPLPGLIKLNRHGTYWLLHGRSGEETRYEEVHISFEGGLFILLTLIGEDSKRTLVVFKDQLAADQYRALNVIGKIHVKKEQSNNSFEQIKHNHKNLC